MSDEPAPPAPPAAPPSPPPPPPGRPHSPTLALILAAALPGAGQAYNGHPFKAVAFLLFSPLLLPWIWSLVDARRAAARLAASGGRYGRGGWVWVFLQAWLAFNVALFTLIVLTLTGVLT